MSTKLPPHSEESERICLGTVLENGQQFTFLRNEMKFTQEFFFQPAHAMVFAAMDALFSVGRPCDAHAVQIQLKKDGVFETVGGHGFLAGLIEVAPADGLIGMYAEKVKQDFDKRCIITAARAMERESMNPENDDARSIASSGVEALCRIVEARSARRSIADIAKGHIDTWGELAALKREGKPVPMRGIPTGFERLDGLTSGLQPCLIILGAQESTGKTSMEAQMLSKIMTRINAPVIRFTRDSQESDLVKRDLVRTAFTPLHYLDAGYMNAVQKERLEAAVAQVVKWDTKIVDDVWKLPDLIAMVRADVARRKTRIVTLDFLQMYRSGDKAVDRSRNDRMEEIITALKGLTLELNICVIALSQFSRESGDEFKSIKPINWLDSRPQLRRLKDSSAIEQQADVVILMSKICDLDGPDGIPNGDASLIGVEVAKNRNGKKGTVMMRFDGPMFHFEELPELKQLAIAKFLRDERDVKTKRLVQSDVKQPSYCSINDAMDRSHLMEVKK